jgi:cysteine-rich secretory family protein
MGLENRDWHRGEKPKRRPRRDISGALIVVATVVGLVVAGGVLKMTRGQQPTFEGEKRHLSGDAKISLLPGTPSITLHHDSLYFPHDRWLDYLADEQTCPGGERTDLPLDQQANVMVCLINYAREKRGLTPLTPVRLLNTTSVAKAEKIVRCKEFKHEACGEEAFSDARAAGYTGSWGENLYIASGRFGAPRVAIDGWLNSPGHRENLFRPEWRTQGIAVQKLDRFGDQHDAALWVSQFGTD